MNELSLRAGSPTSPFPPASLAAEEILRRLFRGWAYIEARFDVLQPMNEGSSVDLGQTYNVADEAGGVLSLRPDFTSLVAREAATMGQGIIRPLRQSYCGTAFRKPDRAGDRRREIRQSGVELVGASGPLADAEIVTLASEGLAALHLKDAQIHLGHVGFVHALLRSSNLTEEGKTTVCNLLARHDRTALSIELTDQGVSGKAAAALGAVLDLVGSTAVLDQARCLTRDPGALRALEQLEELVDLLSRSELPVPVVIDLTEVRDRSYYTGIRFEGFVPASGFPILRGGRYDDLVQQFGKAEPAVGCAFEIDRIAPMVAGSRTADVEMVLLRSPAARWTEVIMQARALRSQGQRVALDVSSLLPGELDAYRSAYRISHVLELESDRELNTEGDRR
ncbi:ATP phosphoribosyltransferase regulatory subunit [Candidatus Bipolaricaulota bacterium]|nr:ATP phosphoribosyltransferase regulatory subunit [Candidatus Bipolaricaulota bacterium]